MVRINIARLRESMGLTQDEFATKVGVAKRTIGRWEQGFSDPSPMAIDRLRSLQAQVDGREVQTRTPPRRQEPDRAVLSQLLSTGGAR